MTLQSWTQHLADRQAYLDPTNLEQLDRQERVIKTRGTGKTQPWMGSRWVAEIAWTSKLFWGMNIGMTALAREGFPFPAAWRAVRPSNGWGNVVDVLTRKLGVSRLPDFWTLHAHLEKTAPIRHVGTLAFIVEGFNLLNNAIILGMNSRADLPDRFRKITELVAPRVFRVGLSLDF